MPKRKSQSSFLLCLRLRENLPRRLSSFVSERSSSVIVGSDTTYAPLPAGGVSFSCPVIVPVGASTDVSFSFSC